MKLTDKQKSMARSLSERGQIQWMSCNPHEVRCLNELVKKGYAKLLGEYSHRVWHPTSNAHELRMAYWE